MTSRRGGYRRQPIREMPASETGGHGTRAEMEALQQAAPLPEVVDEPAVPTAERPLVPGGANIFRPTDRPSEPQTAGLVQEPQLLPEDPDMLLRQIYAVFPDPYLLRLISES